MVKTGDVFNVTVIVDNIPDDRAMAGAEFHLNWNSSVVAAVDAVKVLFHEASPSNVWNNTLEFSHDIEYTASSVSYVYADDADDMGVSGNQTLAIITLEAVGQGSTVLNFSKVDACSLDTDSFDLSAIGCNVSVAQGGEVNPIVGSNGDMQPHYVMSIVTGSEVNADMLVLPSWSAWNGTPFSVDVQLVDVEDMAGYDFGLSWSSKVLNCTNVAIFKPDSWPSTIDINFGINNTSGAGLGTYRLASAGGAGFSGTTIVATLTFLPVGQGVSALTFFSAQLCAYNLETIPCSATTGSVTVNMGQPPPITQNPQESPVPNRSRLPPVTVGNSTEPAQNGGQAVPAASGNAGSTIDNEQIVFPLRLDLVLMALPFLLAFGFVSASIAWLSMPKKRYIVRRHDMD